MNKKEIAALIDHALLSPSLTADQMEDGIRMAREQEVASVCILPFYLQRCVEMLEGSRIKPGTTIGFPHGTHSTAVKVAEANRALHDGAQELDMVVNISRVLSGNWDAVRVELQEIIGLTHAAGQKIKVIFENCYLNDSQKILLCEICSDFNADWVKTSTGFGSGGATIEDVKLMRTHSPSHVQIKAAGGIRTLEAVMAFAAAGASRIGTSRTVEILQQFDNRRPT